MQRQESGFTLIELVIVIVIIGILAATALPRFINVTSNARVAAVEGLAGGMRSAAALAHAYQIANNLSINDSVKMGSQTVTMVNGYPTTDANGIQLALSDYADFTPTSTGTTGTDTFLLDNLANCGVVYNNPDSATAPLASVETSGC